MHKYKPSQYNITGEMSDGNYLVYNTLSSSVAIMSKTEIDQMTHPETAPDDWIQECFRIGFLVYEEEAEFPKVLSLRNMNNFNTRRAGIQILPTTGCNARCFYCYEKNFKIETMSESTVHDTILFLKNFLSTFEEVSIAWFGGEPLVRFDIIEKISQEILPFLAEKGIHYESNMITNAALLNDEIIQKFAQYKISSVQITIDGYRETHDARKNYCDPAVCYDRIIEQIRKLVQARIKVLIRLNVDRNNLDSCLQAIEDLAQRAGISEYLWPYIAPLYSDKGYEGCFAQEELSDVFKKGFKKLIDCGYIQSINGLPMNFSNATCCAKMVNNYVISPKGELSKCEHLLGNPDDIVGNVRDGIIFNHAMTLWTDPYVPEPCQTCAYLPLCQAGCYAAEKRGFGYGRCSYIRFINDATVSAADYLLHGRIPGYNLIEEGREKT